MPQHATMYGTGVVKHAAAGWGAPLQLDGEEEEEQERDKENEYGISKSVGRLRGNYTRLVELNLKKPLLHLC